MNTEVLQYIIKAKDEASKGFEKVQKSAENAGLSMKTIGVAAGVAVAGFAAATAASVKFSEEAGRLTDVQNTFTKLSENAGKSSQHFLDQFQNMTDKTVSNADLMKQSVKASMLGIPIDKMGSLMEIARTQAVAMGEDVGYMLDSIVTGVGRASPLILDNLGITLKMGEVYENAAKALGKTSEELTDTERKTALLNAVTEWGAQKQEEMGGKIESSAAKAMQFKARLENLKNDGLQKLQPVFDAVITIAERALDVFDRLGGLIGNFASKVQSAESPLSAVNESLTGVFGSMDTLKGYLEIISGQWGAFKERIDDVSITFYNFNDIIAQIQQGFDNMFANSDSLNNWGDLWGRLAGLLTGVSDIFFRLLSPAINNFKTALEDSKPMIDELLQTLGPIMVDTLQILAGLLAGVITLVLGLLSAIMTAFSEALPYIIQTFTGMAQFIQGIMGIIVGIFTGDWKKVWESTKTAAEGIWNVISGMIQTVLNAIKGFVKGIIDFFKNLWDVLVGHSIIPDMVEAIIKWIQKMVDDVLDKIRGWVSSIADLGNQLYDKLTSPFKRAWETIKDIADKVRSTIAEAFDMDKRNSPSINDRLDMLKTGVQTTLDSIVVPKYSSDISRALSPTNQTSNETTNNVTFQNTINNDLDLAVVDQQLAISLSRRGMY